MPAVMASAVSTATVPSRPAAAAGATLRTSGVLQSHSAHGRSRPDRYRTSPSGHGDDRLHRVRRLLRRAQECQALRSASQPEYPRNQEGKPRARGTPPTRRRQPGSQARSTMNRPMASASGHHLIGARKIEVKDLRRKSQAQETIHTESNGRHRRARRDKPDQARKMRMQLCKSSATRGSNNFRSNNDSLSTAEAWFNMCNLHAFLDVRPTRAARWYLFDSCHIAILGFSIYDC